MIFHSNVRLALATLPIGIVGAALLMGFPAFGTAEPPPKYRLAKVEAGPIVSAVSASGTVNPVVTVVVGSQLSGQIKEVLVNFNTVVRKGQVLARLDTEQVRARLAQAQAELAVSVAYLEQQTAELDKVRGDLKTARAALASKHARAGGAEALIREADRDLQRKRELAWRGIVTTADGERAQTAAETTRAQLSAAKAEEEQAAGTLEAAHSAVRVAAARIAGAEAQIEQRRAAVRQTEVDLENSEIRAPIDGVVIQRSVDVGQTVAASFQAPTLFTIAQNMNEVEIWTSIDEGDVGRVALGQSATFSVVAHPGLIFRGRVTQVRVGSQSVQNVVTYTVLVRAENHEQKLLPGMTATVRIISASRDSALRVPTAALRFTPPGLPREDGSLGDNFGNGPGDSFARDIRRELTLSPEQQQQLVAILDSMAERVAAARAGDRDSSTARDRVQSIRQATRERILSMLSPTQQAHYAELEAGQNGSGPGRVWVLDGREPRPVRVRLGINDAAASELVSGDLIPGQSVVIGMTATTPAGSVTAQPRL